MKPLILLLFVTVSLGHAACIVVSGDRILAADLAQAAPVFGGLPPQLPFGYAPVPGSRRTFSTAELARLAHRYGFAEPQSEACFIRPLETLTQEKIEAALRVALPSARIEVVEFSRQPVPPGELRFPLSGLSVPRASAPEEPVLWRGHAGPVGDMELAIWAKVRIHLAGKRAVAVETLEPGRPIERDQLRLEDYDGPPVWLSLPEVLGRAARQRIAEGTPLETRMLADADDVLNGDNVRVEVLCGRARLLLEGQAQASGKRGETIAVRNPATGKLFHARIQARDQVSVAAAWLAQGEPQ
jgi:flagella basal body P-ring formation protein FlgA